MCGLAVIGQQPEFSQRGIKVGRIVAGTVGRVDRPSLTGTDRTRDDPAVRMYPHRLSDTDGDGRSGHGSSPKLGGLAGTLTAGGGPTDQRAHAPRLPLLGAYSLQRASSDRLQPPVEGLPMGTAFGDALRSLRARAGLSLAALAREVPYSKSHIGNVETGTRQADRTFAEACDRALGTSPLLVLLNSNEGGEMERRALLTHIGTAVAIGTVSSGVLSEVVRHGLLDDAGAVDDWDAHIGEYRRRFVADPSEEFGARLLSDLMLVRQKLTERARERAELLRASAGLGQLYGLWLGNIGDLSGAKRWYQSAATLADQSQDLNTRTFVRGRSLSRGVYESYSIRETLAGADEVFAISDRPSEGTMEAYGARVSAYAIVGDAASGRKASAGMAQVAERLSASTGAVERAAFMHAYAECRYGTLADAERACTAALPMLKHWPLWASETRVYLGRAMVANGDVSGGISYALSAVSPLRHKVRVISVAVGDVLAAVPARHRSEDLYALRDYAAAGPKELVP